MLFLAHLSCETHKVIELIVYLCSGVRRSSWPVKAKFHVEPAWDGGTKVYINGPGHMESYSES